MMTIKSFEFAELATNSGSNDHDRKTHPQELFSPFGTEPEEAFCHTDDDLREAVETAKRTTAIEVEATVRKMMADDINQRQCDVLNAIKVQLTEQREAFDRELVAIARASQELALAMVKAIVPRAIDQQPLADVTDHLKNTIMQLHTPTSIDVRLAPELVDLAQALLSEVAVEARFKGRIDAVPDPDLALGDATIHWKGGEVERRLDRIQAEVLNLVEQWLPAQPSDCATPGTEHSAIEEPSKAPNANDITSTTEQVNP